MQLHRLDCILMMLSIVYLPVNKLLLLVPAYHRAILRPVKKIENKYLMYCLHGSKTVVSFLNQSWEKDLSERSTLWKIKQQDRSIQFMIYCLRSVLTSELS